MKIALYMPKYHSESYDFFKNVFYKHDLLLTHSVDCLEENINLVIIRNNGMDYSDLDLDQFEARGLRTLNSIRSHRLSRDKLKSLDYFKQLNLKIPEFMMDKRDFPYIQKSIRGMQGRGVELIKSQNDLISSPYRNDDRKFFQRYLELPEYRFIYFMGEEFYLKKDGQMWRKNIACSQFNLIAPLEHAFIELAKLTSDLGAQFYAVDFFMDKESPIFFDLNTVVGTKWLLNNINPSKLLKCQEFLSFN